MSTVTASMNQNRTASIVLGVILIVALVAILFLPPISLGERLSTQGMKTVQANTDSNVQDPDGTQVAFPSYGVAENFKAKLTSIPRETFLSGNAGDEARLAAEAIPTFLNPRSPQYDLQVKGNAPLASVLTVPIPNDSQPYETLDVYEWDGAAWKFVPSHVVADDDLIVSELNYVPKSFMVMQTNALPPTAAAVLPVGQDLPDAGRDALTAASPLGYSLQGDGTVAGNVAASTSAGGSYGVAPVIRNWGDDGVVRTDLLDNLLIDPGIQDNQLKAIEALVAGNNYPGVEIDYRGLDPTLAREFTDFVTALADQLHASGKTLALRVEAPKQISEDQWTTGGYDWRTLGQVVDSFQIPAPIDPKAYVEGGQVDSLLKWSVGEVPREKIELVLPARSVEQAGAYLLPMGYDEALKPLLGEGRSEKPVLVPGEPVDITLFNDRVIGGLNYDDQVGQFTYNYRDDTGYQRTVWIENAASIANKLKLIGKYNLKGVALEHMLEPSFDPDIWSVVREFLAGENAARASKFGVVWTVTKPDGQVEQVERPIDAAAFEYTAPQAEGEIKISANIADNGKMLASGPVIALALATATPMPTPTPVATPTPSPTPTPSFASAVAAQTVNLRSGPGTAFGNVGQLNAGDSLKIVGKNQDGSWWQVELPNGSTAWVIAERVRTQGPADQVAVAKDIPAPPQQVAAAAPAPVAQAQPAPAAQAAPAAQPAAVAPAPKPTGGGAFGYGIQVSPYNIPFLAGKIQGMGFNWVKIQLPWKDLEGSPGAIGWGGTDDIVNQFANAGIKVFLSVPKAPSWARPANADLSVEGPPADPNTFANFLGQLAGRYCGKVGGIEVWNEQNLHYEWGNQPLDPAGYMALLKPAYRAIKAACPSTYVISGALTPTGAPAPWAMDDFTYLEGMYQNGLKDYADGIGAHPSGYNVPPDVRHEDACATIQRTGNSFNGPCDSVHHSWSFRSTMEGYRNIMAKYGDTNKKIWPTEFGWAAGGAFDDRYKYANDNDYNEQAEWTVRAYQMMKNWGWVGPAFLWNLNFRMTNNGTELAQWGILDAGGGPLPAYSALAGMPK